MCRSSARRDRLVARLVRDLSQPAIVPRRQSISLAEGAAEMRGVAEAQAIGDVSDRFGAVETGQGGPGALQPTMQKPGLQTTITPEGGGQLLGGDLQDPAEIPSWPSTGRRDRSGRPGRRARRRPWLPWPGASASGHATARPSPSAVPSAPPRPCPPGVGGVEVTQIFAELAGPDSETSISVSFASFETFSDGNV
jgi:hypothetical protein